MQYKILYIVPEMHSGGVENNVAEFSSYMVEKGHSVYILTSDIKTRKAINHKVNILIKNVKTKNPFRIFLNAFLILRIVQKFNITIVHVKSRAPAISCYIAKLIDKNFKFVSTFHGRYELENFFKYLYCLPMAKADQIIAVSSRVKEYILNHFPSYVKNKLTYINRGIDITIYNPDQINREKIIKTMQSLNIRDDSIKIILFPGRLSYNKGHMWLIESLARLKRKDYKCVFATGRIVKQDFKNLILQKIRDYNLQENIIILDDIDDIKVAYFLSHVALSISTKEESFGRIPIEAGAIGRPVIASNLGTYKITVVNNKTGWLVEKNNINDLTNAIDKCLNLKKDEWNAICSDARKYIEENFDIIESFEKTEEVYAKLLYS